MHYNFLRFKNVCIFQLIIERHKIGSHVPFRIIKFTLI